MDTNQTNEQAYKQLGKKMKISDKEL